jgi:hypothetical protein
MQSPGIDVEVDVQLFVKVVTLPAGLSWLAASVRRCSVLVNLPKLKA